MRKCRRGCGTPERPASRHEEKYSPIVVYYTVAFQVLTKVNDLIAKTSSSDLTDSITITYSGDHIEWQRRGDVHTLQPLISNSKPKTSFGLRFHTNAATDRNAQYTLDKLAHRMAKDTHELGCYPVSMLVADFHRTTEKARCTGDPKHRLAIWQTQAKKDPAGKELYNN